MRKSRCRATARPASSAPSSRTFTGLRPDLAHLVDGRPSPAVGAYATFVVFAWRDRDEDIIPAEVVARIDRANRRCPRGLHCRLRRRRHERASNAQPRRSRLRREQAVAQLASEHAASERGVETHRRRLRLLDLPAQRHRHVLRVLRELRRARRGRRRAGRAERELFDLAQHRASRTACLLLSSFTCGLASIGAQSAPRLLVLSAPWR